MLVQLYKGGIDNYGFRICIYGQHAKDVIPDLQSGPFEEAFMYRVPRPKLRMQVPLRCACFHNPQDSIKYQAVVFTFASSGFSTGLRQHRPDYGPLFVGMSCLLMEKQKQQTDETSRFYLETAPRARLGETS